MKDTIWDFVNDDALLVYYDSYSVEITESSVLTFYLYCIPYRLTSHTLTLIRVLSHRHSSHQTTEQQTLTLPSLTCFFDN